MSPSPSPRKRIEAIRERSVFMDSPLSTPREILLRVREISQLSWIPPLAWIAVGAARVKGGRPESRCTVLRLRFVGPTQRCRISVARAGAPWRPPRTGYRPRAQGSRTTLLQQWHPRLGRDGVPSAKIRGGSVILYVPDKGTSTGDVRVR